ncbi:hypothetical protein GW17_00020500, partial [Ensete ventricosum]
GARSSFSLKDALTPLAPSASSPSSLLAVTPCGLAAGGRPLAGASRVATPCGLVVDDSRLRAGASGCHLQASRYGRVPPLRAGRSRSCPQASPLQGAALEGWPWPRPGHGWPALHGGWPWLVAPPPCCLCCETQQNT